MTIRQLRDLSAAIAAAVILLMAAVLLWANLRVDRAIASNQASVAINKAVGELRYLVVDSILHRESRARLQWQSKHRALLDLLARQKLEPANQDLVEQITRNAGSVGALYPLLIKYQGDAAAGSIAERQYRELEDRVVSRLIGQTQEMLSATFRLADSSQAEVMNAQDVLTILIPAFTAAIAAAAIAAWILVTRRILLPLASLQRGTETVAAGNLDFRLGMGHADEVGSLARAFDEMTGKVERAHGLITVANKELETFSYSVSHDLRAPLRSMDGFSQMLLEDYADKLDADGKDSLHRIRAASQRMGVLIDDMLALSQVTRREIALGQVDLSAMAAAIVADLRQREPQRQVEVMIAPALVARTDPHLIRIALANLLENAWKFTGKRARASIEFNAASHDGKRAYLVRDNGVGFDMAHAGKLFGAFQRMHRSDEFAGTGIGLATVQRIVHRLGGQVWAEAAPERGATFYFALNEGGTP